MENNNDSIELQPNSKQVRVEVDLTNLPVDPCPSNKGLTPQHITPKPNENKTADLSSLILNPSTEKSFLSSLPEAGSRHPRLKLPSPEFAAHARSQKPEAGAVWPDQAALLRPRLGRTAAARPAAGLARPGLV
jgi:hypothetical protein